MGKRGFGSLRRLPSKRYQAGYDHSGDRWVAPSTFRTKGDAESWLVKERDLIESGRWTSPQERVKAAEKAAEVARRNTFGVYAERYLATRGLRPKTLDQYQRIIATSLLPTFSGSQLAEITKADVRDWYDTHSPGSVREYAYRILRAILTEAERDDLIERVPTQIRGAGQTKRRTTPPATLDELDLIVQAMPEDLRLFVMLAGWCGLRKGELLELRRSDVDTRAGTISIKRAVSDRKT